MDNQLYKRCLLGLILACVGLGGYFSAATSFSSDKVISIDVPTTIENIEDEDVYVAIEGSRVKTNQLNYPIVDTGQTAYYNNQGPIESPNEGQDFYGQDAHYEGRPAQYRDNGDGTITDEVTGLMWQQDPGDKVTYQQGIERAEVSTLAGYEDWRVPTIKELYSLINFNGKTGMNANSSIPYIDDSYFVFKTGNIDEGERFIDGQYMTQTLYTGTTMLNNQTMFSVNFVDGRIKGYPVGQLHFGKSKEYYLLMVRGNASYGDNNFVDNGDGTITDLSTGLMWAQTDSGYGMEWQEALAYAENSNYAGYEDWKLPDAKELHSIVDYSRSLDATSSSAINSIFETTAILDEGKNDNYPFFWTSTTHLDGPKAGESAVYMAFGEALGYMRFPESQNQALLDVHGAGAQRSDPKTGDASMYPNGFGPQGDVRRIDNYVRLVRRVQE